MQFDPKVSFWLGVVVTALIGIAGGTVHLTNAIPADWIPAVTAWASLLSFVGSGLLTAMHAYSSPQSGPLVSQPAPSVPKVLLPILLAAGLTMAWAGPAAAQQRQTQPFRPTGDLVKDIAATKQAGTAAGNETTLDLVAKLQALSLPDFQYALAMSKATKNVVSTPCWQAWVDLITAQQAPLMGPGPAIVDAAGKPVLDASGNPTFGPPQVLSEPDPHLITNIERVSELLAALRPDSPLTTNCAALAGAAGKDVATLAGGLLSGSALGLFKLPIIP